MRRSGGRRRAAATRPGSTRPAGKTGRCFVGDGGPARALGPGLAAPGPAGLLVLEHEYRLARNGDAVDFRALIHDLPVPGRRIDPGDSYAYRCTSGLALTCDDGEAEVACPPVP